MGLAASTAAFVALVPGLVAFSAIKILAIYGMATRGIRPMTILAVCGAAINVGANVLLIPRFGSVGGSLSSSVSYGTISILGAVWFLRRSGLKSLLVPVPVPALSDWSAIASIAHVWKRVDHAG